MLGSFAGTVKLVVLGLDKRWLRLRRNQVRRWFHDCVKACVTMVPGAAREDFDLVLKQLMSWIESYEKLGLVVETRLYSESVHMLVSLAESLTFTVTIETVRKELEQAHAQVDEPDVYMRAIAWQIRQLELQVNDASKALAELKSPQNWPSALARRNVHNPSDYLLRKHRELHERVAHCYGLVTAVKQLIAEAQAVADRALQDQQLREFWSGLITLAALTTAGLGAGLVRISALVVGATSASTLVCLRFWAGQEVRGLQQSLEDRAVQVAQHKKHCQSAVHELSTNSPRRVTVAGLVAS